MVAVIEFADVTVRRGSATLLDKISWRVAEGERWVVLGPNGAGKTTLLQVASAQIHPTDGVAGILDEVLGTVDVFELRPRIGLTSAALAERIPRARAGPRRRRERVVRRGRALARGVRRPRPRPRPRAARRGPGRPPARPHLRHAQRGRAQAGADRPGADGRPRAAAARRAGRRPRPRRPGGPRVSRCRPSPSTRASPATVLVSHHVEEIPPGFTHALLLRAGPGRRRRPDPPGDHRGAPHRDLRHAARAQPTRRAAGPRVDGRGAAPAPDPDRPSGAASRDRLQAWSGWGIISGPPGWCWRSLWAWPRWSAST